MLAIYSPSLVFFGILSIAIATENYSRKSKILHTLISQQKITLPKVLSTHNNETENYSAQSQLHHNTYKNIKLE